MTRARLDGWVRLAPVVFVFVLSLLGRQAGAQDRPPNIVYIMSDELAYYELGHMGNTHIRTPRIDRMAREGLRFTRAYAGSCVCAPLRCNLMTGLHAGHASVRANDGGTPLREGEATIAVDGSEITDHRWLRPLDAHRLRDEGEIELSPPTWITLWQLASHPSAASAVESFAAGAPEHFATRVAVLDDEVHALYAGDAGYEASDATIPGPRHRLRMRGSTWVYERDV